MKNVRHLHESHVWDIALNHQIILTVQNEPIFWWNETVQLFKYFSSVDGSSPDTVLEFIASWRLTFIYLPENDV